jgi:hypothetical protein
VAFFYGRLLWVDPCRHPDFLCARFPDNKPSYLITKWRSSATIRHSGLEPESTVDTTGRLAGRGLGRMLKGMTFSNESRYYGF